MKRNPSGTTARRTYTGCQAASAMSSSPSVHPMSYHRAPLATSGGLHEIQRVGQPETANPTARAIQVDPSASRSRPARPRRRRSTRDRSTGRRARWRPLAAGPRRVERRLEDDRRAQRGDRQRRDRAVSPQGLGTLRERARNSSTTPTSARIGKSKKPASASEGIGGDSTS